MQRQKNSLKSEFYKKSKAHKQIEKEILQMKMFNLFIDYKQHTINMENKKSPD